MNLCRPGPSQVWKVPLRYASVDAVTALPTVLNRTVASHLNVLKAENAQQGTFEVRTVCTTGTVFEEIDQVSLLWRHSRTRKASERSSTRLTASSYGYGRTRKLGTTGRPSRK